MLQESLISPMLFDLYINDLINELEWNAFEVLAYADDLWAREYNNLIVPIISLFK